MGPAEVVVGPDDHEWGADPVDRCLGGYDVPNGVRGAKRKVEVAQP